MIRVFNAEGSRWFAADVPEILPANFVWLDLIHPEAEEERRLESQLGIDLPSADEMRDIEPSSRLYHEGGATFMTASIVWRASTDEPESAPITFILHRERLITIRYSEPRPFVAFAAYLQKNAAPFRSGPHAMVGLVEAVVDRTAEILESSGAEIDTISRTVFRFKQANGATAGASSQVLRDLLARIALNQNLVAKARESLVSLGRVMSFFAATQELSDRELREHVRSVSRDIHSLTDHASFLTSNTTFSSGRGARPYQSAAERDHQDFLSGGGDVPAPNDDCLHLWHEL